MEIIVAVKACGKILCITPIDCFPESTPKIYVIFDDIQRFRNDCNLTDPIDQNLAV